MNGVYLMAWDLKSFFTNVANYIKGLGGPILAVLGFLLLLYGSYQIFKYIKSSKQGEAEIQWVKVILAFIIGGFFITSGVMTTLEHMGQGAKKTVDDLGRDGTPSNNISIVRELKK